VAWLMGVFSLKVQPVIISLGIRKKAEPKLTD